MIRKIRRTCIVSQPGRRSNSTESPSYTSDLPVRVRILRSREMRRPLGRRAAAGAFSSAVLRSKSSCSRPAPHSTLSREYRTIRIHERGIGAALECSTRVPAARAAGCDEYLLTLIAERSGGRGTIRPPQQMADDSSAAR